MTKEVKLVVVATINTSEMNSFNTYIKGLTKCYEKVGAKTESQYSIESTYLGNTKPDFVSVISFKDKDAFDTVYKSDEYKKLLNSRDKAFKTIEVYIVKN